MTAIPAKAMVPVSAVILAATSELSHLRLGVFLFRGISKVELLWPQRAR